MPMAGVVFPATKLLGWSIHTEGKIKEEKPVRFYVLLVCPEFVYWRECRRAHRGHKFIGSFRDCPNWPS